MPNWCNNFLSIECDVQTTETIKRKLEDAKIYSGSLGRLLKDHEQNLSCALTDEDKERITSEYQLKRKKLEMTGVEDGCVNVFQTLVGLPNNATQEEYRVNSYDINVNGYGTKWDIDYEEHSWDFYDEGGISVNFETAWSPPEGFVRMLMSQYKGITSLELQYEEGGCDFCGKFTLSRGIGLDDYYAHDECYGYIEGLYRLDMIDCFWSEAENYLDNDFDSVEDFLRMFSFLNENDNEDKITINELKTMYEEHYADAN